MEIQTIISNYTDFLYFYKQKYPESIFHNSNVFHRDVQYVLTDYVMKKENKMMPVAKSELLAFQVESEFEKKGIFKKLNEKSWVLNYPDFTTKKVEKK